MLRCPGSDGTPEALLRVAASAIKLYRVAGRKKKPDGSKRIVFDAMFPLKTIQARIQCMILKKVNYPEHLQGSIKKRGQASNARCHVNRRLLITEDVENFFPATSFKVIFEVWHRFFGFPPAVAECLTNLTTKDGTLPQGAKTSPLLANIVFWQAEEKLVVALAARGIVYTRLVDDITCSAKQDLTQEDVDWVIAKIREMTQSLGYKLKSSKETIADASRRMVATKLVVNAKVALPSEQRSKIRAAVNRYQPAQTTRASPDKDFNSVSGHVSYLTQHHASEGAALRERLNAARKRVTGNHHGSD